MNVYSGPLSGRSQVALVSLHGNQQHVIEAFKMCDELIMSATTVPGYAACDDKHAYCDSTVWMGTDEHK